MKIAESAFEARGYVTAFKTGVLPIMHLKLWILWWDIHCWLHLGFDNLMAVLTLR